MSGNVIDKNSQFTPAEAAELLRVAPVTVRSWAQKGWINAEVTAGGHRRFSGLELVRFAADRGLSLHWPDRQRSRVMIVEDDAYLANYLSELLSEVPSKPEVKLVYDGFEAGLQMIVFKPDVVLLDLMMPGMDGFAVCGRIKANPLTKFTRVIAMTGYPSPENIQRILALGAETCLKKPFTSEDLLSALNLQVGVEQELNNQSSSVTAASI